MDKTIISQMNFQQYLVDNIQLNVNPSMNENEMEFELNLKIQHDISIDMNSNSAALSIETIIFDDYIEKNYPFYLKLNIIGYFTFRSEFTEQKIKDMLELNGVTILFPYIRSLVSLITSNSGLPTLILPTINITKLIQKNKKS